MWGKSPNQSRIPMHRADGYQANLCDIRPVHSNRERPAHRGVRCQGCLEAWQFVLNVVHWDQQCRAAIPNDRVDCLGHLPCPGLRLWIWWEQPTVTIREWRLEEIEYQVQSRYVNNTAASVDDQRGCLSLHWGIHYWFLWWRLNPAPILRGGMNHGCLVGYALCKQGNASHPRPQGCQGGIHELESGVPLQRRLLCLCPLFVRLVRKRDKRKDPCRASAKPHLPRTLPSIAPSLHFHGIAILKEPPPYAAFEFHVLRPPPAQFQHATKATTDRAWYGPGG